MRFEAERLARMLLECGSHHGPLHQRLSVGLRKLIHVGELPPDALLPSERALASALSVSRTTVVAAYQTLRSDGLVERRQGSGTRVSPPGGRGQREMVSAPVLSGDHAAAGFVNESLATIDLCTAALPSLALVPEVAAGLTSADYAEISREHHGYHPRGLPALRERIAQSYTNAGTPTRPDQVLITSGAQQALELVTHGCLQPGDSVVTEAPTYRGALEAFRLANCRIASVSHDDHGMDVERVERLVTDQPVRLVYVQSCVHNPTGSVLADGRRRRLARLAERNAVIVVDDTALAGTLVDGLPPQPLAGLTSSERLLTIGSMSKLFWGGLRVGWIRGSAQVISRLAQMKGITDLGTSLVSQQISVHLLDRFTEAQATRREQLATGLDHLTGLLERHLPEWSWQQPRGGGSLWVRIPTTSVTNFAHEASRFGVAILSGALFRPDGGGEDHTRLPYAVSRTTLTAGVQRLARAWQAHADSGPPIPHASVTT